MESNVFVKRNLIEDNKTYKYVSKILRQKFPEVSRGFSERNVRLCCAKYGIRRLNEYEVDFTVQDCVNEVSLFLFMHFFVSVIFKCEPTWRWKRCHWFSGRPVIFKRGCQ